MKKIVCLCLSLVFLFIFSSCHSHLSGDEMEELLEENKGLFEKAVQEIMLAPCEGILSIEKSHPNNDRLYVVQIRDLYFSSTRDDIDEDLCAKMYNSVEPLFSHAGVEGIAYNTSQIQFSMQLPMKMDAGYESSIIYVYSGQEPSSSYTILEKSELGENWYVVVARD